MPIKNGLTYKQHDTGHLYQKVAPGAQHDVVKMRRLIGRRETIMVTGTVFAEQFEEMV